MTEHLLHSYCGQALSQALTLGTPEAPVKAKLGTIGGHVGARGHMEAKGTCSLWPFWD